LLWAVALLGACGGGTEHYPREVRHNFLSACQSNGGTRSRCACALDKIESKVSLKQFKRDEAALRAGGSLPRVYTDAVADCE
jgi:hypothetical protein